MIQHTRVSLPWKYLRHHLHKYQGKDINCRTLILFSSHFLSLHGGDFPLYFPLSLPHSHYPSLPYLPLLSLHLLRSSVGPSKNYFFPLEQGGSVLRSRNENSGGPRMFQLHEADDSFNLSPGERQSRFSSEGCLGGRRRKFIHCRRYLLYLLEGKTVWTQRAV